MHAREGASGGGVTCSCELGDAAEEGRIAGVVERGAYSIQTSISAGFVKWLCVSAEGVLLGAKERERANVAAMLVMKRCGCYLQ